MSMSARMVMSVIAPQRGVARQSGDCGSSMGAYDDRMHFKSRSGAALHAASLMDCLLAALGGGSAESSQNEGEVFSAMKADAVMRFFASTGS